jgi:hypothetical protein
MNKLLRRLSVEGRAEVWTGDLVRRAGGTGEGVQVEAALGGDRSGRKASCHVRDNPW